VPWLALGVIVALLATLQKLEWAAVLATVLVAAIVYLIGRTRREAMIAQYVGSR
jgi:hypothetical protein